MAEVLVDVVAAARRVMAANGTPEHGVVAHRQAPESPAAPAEDAGVRDCPLGHSQPAETRFCGECGLPMADGSFGSRVDLDAVRASVQSRALDPAQRAERDRQHADALAANLRAEQAVPDISQVADPSERKILIHFVEDGFTWKKVWLKGEMLEIGPDHPWWEGAQSWIRLTKVQQFERYGRVFFDFGPYPGQGMKPGTDVPLATSPAARWAELRGGVPARPDPEGTGSLVPW